MSSIHRRVYTFFSPRLILPRNFHSPLSDRLKRLLRANREDAPLYAPPAAKKNNCGRKTKAGKTIHFATVFIHVTETIKKTIGKKSL
jgi:hypothetical protein